MISFLYHFNTNDITFIISISFLSLMIKDTEKINKHDNNHNND